jgi:hypothetical protein
VLITASTNGLLRLRLLRRPAPDSSDSCESMPSISFPRWGHNLTSFLFAGILGPPIREDRHWPPPCKTHDNVIPFCGPMLPFGLCGWAVDATHVAYRYHYSGTAQFLNMLQNVHLIKDNSRLFCVSPPHSSQFGMMSTFPNGRLTHPRLRISSNPVLRLNPSQSTPDERLEAESFCNYPFEDDTAISCSNSFFSGPPT